MPVTSHADANAIILAGYMSALDEFQTLNLAEVFTSICTSTIEAEKCSQFFEIVYANRDALTPDVIDAAVEIGAYATTMRFYGLGEDSRGFQMLQVLQGVTEEGPAPVARYLPPVLEAPAPEDLPVPPLPGQPEGEGSA